MPDGATTQVVTKAYPNRAEAKVGASEKTLRATEVLVDKAEAHLATVTTAAEAHLAYCEGERDKAEAVFDTAAAAYTDNEVAAIVSQRLARQAVLNKLSAAILAAQKEARDAQGG